MSYGNPYGGKLPQEGKLAGAFATVLFWGGLVYIIIKVITFDW